MPRFRKLALIALIAAAAIAALVGAYSMRMSILDQALAELQARKLHRIEIVGVRMPCYGMLDIGVAVVFRLREGGEPQAGRLCRAPAGSEWTWYPNYGQPGAK
jgi:hypothetical protein